MKTFANDRSWTAYRQILADVFAIVFPSEPTERHAIVRGHGIRFDEWRPAEAPVGTLILVHGAGGNGRILAPFALAGLEAGWRVLAPDLPGFGLSEPASDYAWDYAEWSAVVARMADLECTPVVLFGLSVGGMTAVSAAQQSVNVQGVIASTLVDLADPETFAAVARWRWLGRLSQGAMRVAPWLFDRLIMPLRLATPLHAMSRDRRMQRYFQRDRLIGARWLPGRFFRTLHQYPIRTSSLACPLLLAHPGADAWTPTALSMSAFDGIDARKRFLELSNGSHLPVEQPAFAELSCAVRDFLVQIAEGTRPT